MKQNWEKFKQIIEAYVTLFLKLLGFSSPKIEKLRGFRKEITENRCGCIKYLINFWGVRLIPYLSCCGCISEAKWRCKECHCVQGRW